MAYDAYDDGRRDFHFFYGRWAVAHRRLKVRGVGGDDWDEFEGVSYCHGLMGGLCNVDENQVLEHNAQGLTFRTFDIEKDEWVIYCVDGSQGVLQAPVRGRFEGGVGRFHGEGVDGVRPVKVRFVWEGVTPGRARWSQAFSYDEGRSWETNWTMAFTRTA